MKPSTAEIESLSSLVSVIIVSGLFALGLPFVLAQGGPKPKPSASF